MVHVPGSYNGWLESIHWNQNQTNPVHPPENYIGKKKYISYEQLWFPMAMFTMLKHLKRSTTQDDQDSMSDIMSKAVYPATSPQSDGGLYLSWLLGCGCNAGNTPRHWAASHWNLTKKGASKSVGRWGCPLFSACFQGVYYGLLVTFRKVTNFKFDLPSHPSHTDFGGPKLAHPQCKTHLGKLGNALRSPAKKVYVLANYMKKH